MITQAILDFFYAIYALFVNGLPSWTIGVDNAVVTGFVGELTGLNGILPVKEFFTCLTLAGALFVALAGFKFLKLGITMLRGGGS
jgi:hypothetical protein